ncbi:EthD family reductase [Curtobacterium sp. MCPF17_031]|uniref:EthD family reductase n=1 Tax=Curtobacterium sp. MCPF17_031 TaxID=2175653 RepID=UPI000DA73B19|nr:EthD family reductase [Curtobacterium sp. MCPF17_031]PZE34252.1 EthD family reductase [Curtobacterium sp. MCPF17_031]
MATKITFIFNNPTDPAVFEAAYADVVVLAEQLPQLRRTESAKVWPKEDGSATPAYRTLDLYFDSYEDASAAVTTPVAQELFGRLIATDVPFTGLFSDIESA